MLIIAWLNRLPNVDGVIVMKETATNCDSVADADAQADALWPHVQTIDQRLPDGYQVVDQDGRRLQLARYAVDRGSVPDRRFSIEL